MNRSRSESGAAEAETAYPVAHDAGRLRFSCRLQGHEAVLDYRLVEGRMTITHTGVPQAIGGRGVAAALVRTALDRARTKGWRVVPACSYAAAYLRRHPEYANLLARDA